MAFEALKEKHRVLRENGPADLNLRVHRALSWMARAGDVAGTDPDAAFIFYWISFNAAYARDLEPDTSGQARDDFARFFGQLVALDAERRIFKAIWTQFPGPIRLLLTNKYAFAPFWKFVNGDRAYDNWEVRFRNSAVAVRDAFKRKDTPLLLSFLFDRLYVLRNQLVHGGATWNSAVNRQQVGDGVRILGTLMPIFAEIMMDHPEVDWGLPYYPVIK